MPRNLRKKKTQKGKGPAFDAAKLALKWISPILLNEIGVPVVRSLSHALGVKAEKKIKKVTGTGFVQAGKGFSQAGKGASSIRKQTGSTNSGRSENIPTVLVGAGRKKKSLK